jgi:hypothetical protein
MGEIEKIFEPLLNKELEYISINSLQDLKIDGLGQIRSQIIKEDKENGKWKSINCKKLKGKGKVIPSWHIDVISLIENLKNNSMVFRSHKTSKKLLLELKKLYPQYFKDEIMNINDTINKENTENNITKKRKDRDEEIVNNEMQKKLKLERNNEHNFIHFFGKMQDVNEENKNENNSKNFEELFQKLEQRMLIAMEKLLKNNNSKLESN